MGNKLLGDYSPVVNMVTVRLILLLTRIYKLDSKAIDFVLAFPQAKLDVDIWIAYQLVSKLIQIMSLNKVISLNSTKAYMV